jgi:hypothetical protein
MTARMFFIKENIRTANAYNPTLKVPKKILIKNMSVFTNIKILILIKKNLIDSLIKERLVNLKLKFLPKKTIKIINSIAKLSRKIILINIKKSESDMNKYKNK